MTENFIGWALLFLAPIVTSIVVYIGVTRVIGKREEARQRREETLRQLREEREASWQRLRRANSVPVQSQVVGNNSVGIQSRGNVTYTRSQDDSGFDLATMILLNETLNSKSGSVTARVDYDSNTMTVTEEPSTSSNSRWSSDDSPSTSSSWSSSSDSSSSWDSSSSSDVGSSSSWD